MRARRQRDQVNWRRRGALQLAQRKPQELPAGAKRCEACGPWRALEMRDRDFGWTAEMQVKAARRGLRVKEVPVDYRPRIGSSKVSGTVLGSLRAGAGILGTIARHACSRAG